MVTEDRDGDKFELRVLYPCLSAPPVDACLRRSVHGPQKPSLLLPPATLICTSIPVNLYKGETMGRDAAFYSCTPPR
jgi:hypothetical protein